VGGEVESKMGPLGTSAIYWPIVPAPGDCEDGEFGGIKIEPFELCAYTCFLLRMTDTVTSQNIDLSSWDILYFISLR
jgi:hypothetical protein